MPSGNTNTAGSSRSPEFVLASASPARLEVLRRSGLNPQVIVSGVDESSVTSTDPAQLVAELATLKCRAVAVGHLDALVLGCDSVLWFDGQILGKPKTPEVARARWQRMRGKAAVLYTGHCLRLGEQEVQRTVATTVHFADISDRDIDDYIATEEPLQVAGAFTIDGFGGAFIDRIEGDHLNVIGVSVPTLREMTAEIGVRWSSLWR